MDLWAGDDEVLLMELERRDGIYSFIFHELDGNKLQTDLGEGPNEPKQLEKKTLQDNQFQEAVKAEFFNGDVGNTASTATAADLLTKTANAAKSHTYNDCCVKSSSKDFAKSWQTHFNFQFPVTSTHSAFQQFCSLRTFTVRRAKSPFSQIFVPLVRNRRHPLKDGGEYNSFMQNEMQVADLRELFPLDPDAHAPFAVERANVSFRNVAVTDR